MTFYVLLSDAAIRQANWDASEIRDKLCRDIDAHASSVRSAKLSEIIAIYEVLSMINICSVCFAVKCFTKNICSILPCLFHYNIGQT